MPISTLEKVLLRSTRGAAVAHCVLLIATSYWHYKVNATVPDPYLDEVFHVRQATAYWEGQWHVWDPKITTPPGLYIISYLHLYLLHIQGRLSSITSGLRSLNFVAANILIFLQVRSLLHKIVKVRDGDETPPAGRTKQFLQWSRLELDHATLNICLFPPLFFFYGLYYTDVLSVGCVLFAYHFFLNRRRSGLIIAGLSSLLFRQTNIFWVAIFLGGLEVTRTIERGTLSRPAWISLTDLGWGHARYYDPLVSEASFEDYLKTACSIGLCTVVNCRTVLRALAPYLTFLAAFGAFVLWNGGVVLGDKDNHIASLHLSQMLYIWPYMVFFSFPIIHQYLLNWIIPPNSLPKFIRHQYTKQSPARLAIAAPIIAAMLAIVHLNTLVHPFTLADNRHYVFYVFRILLRHPAIRYLAVPIYFFCAWASIRALGALVEPEAPQGGVTGKVKAGGKQGSSPTQNRPAEGNRVSFVLVWLATSALSLITAPLVEPRYFILPWLMWRLQLPSLRPGSQEHGEKKASDRRSSSLPERFKAVFYQKHDHRLWLETLWFLAVNWATGYIFLYWGFSWPQEPGKMQRFMW